MGLNMKERQAVGKNPACCSAPNARYGRLCFFQHTRYGLLCQSKHSAKPNIRRHQADFSAFPASAVPSILSKAATIYRYVHTGKAIFAFGFASNETINRHKKQNFSCPLLAYVIGLSYKGVS